jgi:hypothetical protein
MAVRTWEAPVVAQFVQAFLLQVLDPLDVTEVGLPEILFDLLELFDNACHDWLLKGPMTF